MSDETTGQSDRASPMRHGQRETSEAILLNGNGRLGHRCVEGTLAEQLRLLESLADHASVALLIMDGRQQCRFMNYAAEQLIGYTFAEARGCFLHDVVYRKKPDGYPSPLAECSIDQAFAGEDKVRGEDTFVHKDGHCYPIAFTASRISDEVGKPIGTVIEVRDLSEQKRGDIELEQAVNEKTSELRLSQKRLQALASELNLAEQREQKRLANELHDHLQQMLVAGKLAIGQGKRFASGVPEYAMTLKKVDDILSEALAYSRTLVAELSPPVLHDQGLAAGLKWLGEYMKKKYDQTVTLVLRDDQDIKLPEDQVMLVFQSVRELLINSSKHAGTGEATVRMEQRNGRLQIEVRDEGAGFDLAAAAAAAAAGTPGGGISSKFGLLSIHERMRAMGGSFHIHSAPRQGTTAMLVLRKQC